MSTYPLKKSDDIGHYEYNPGDRYQHYKGDIYVILARGLMEDNCLIVIVYHPEGKPDEVWVRPMIEFEEVISCSDGGIPTRRFTPVE